MARFALFTNGVKVETLDELRENYNINDMLQNFESKALHRWLATKGYEEELKKVESIMDGTLDDSVDLLMDCFALSEEQKAISQQRAKNEVTQISKESCQKTDVDPHWYAPNTWNLREFYPSEDVDFSMLFNKNFQFDIDNLQINGNHNMENLAGVMTVIKTLGLDWRKALSFLPSFEQVAHRLQDVGTIDGVRFINDSISTAPEAAISAMKSFDDNMVIISGGTINQQDYTEYAKFIEANPKVKIAITLFQCGSQIADSIRKYVTRDDFVLIEAEKLSEAVDLAFKGIKLAKGNLVLFSPTAPSFGYYKNFMERGQVFLHN